MNIDTNPLSEALAKVIADSYSKILGDAYSKRLLLEELEPRLVEAKLLLDKAQSSYDGLNALINKIKVSR